MRAPDKKSTTKNAAAVLASGVVISLTALSGGAVPALAKPDDDSMVPTETFVPSAPEPRQESRGEEPARERPVREAPAPVQAPPVVEVPEPIQQAPPVVEAPEPVQQAPVPAPEPAPVQAPPVVEVPEPVQAPPVVEAPKPVRPAPEPEPVQTPRPTRAPAPSRAVPPPAAAEPDQSEAPPSVAPPSRAEQAAEADVPAPVADPAPATREPAQPRPSAEPSPSAADPSPAGERPPGERPSGETKTAEPGPGDPAPSRAAEAGADPSTSAPATDEPDAGTESPETSQAAAIREARPETLLAPDEDIELARRVEPVVQKVVEAPKQEIELLSNAIFGPDRRREGRDDDRDRWQWDKDRWDYKDRWDDKDRWNDRDRWDRDRDRHWDRKVRQWNRDWVEYDRFYRPIFFNPFRNPVRIVYVYLDRPRIVYLPPLTRIVLEAAEFAAYSFTAVVLGAAETALDVAVGTFFGGGYLPRAGVPLPPRPPRLIRYDNVPVQVRYPQAVYQPFRVNRIVDMGDDARFGERKVLLDGATPAWGVWTQNPSGERQFEVHRTQQFPGLDEPQAGPLPGDYPLRLAAEESAGLDRTQMVLYTAAGVVAALGFGALGMAVYLGRRRPTH